MRPLAVKLVLTVVTRAKKNVDGDSGIENETVRVVPVWAFMTASTAGARGTQRPVDGHHATE